MHSEKIGDFYKYIRSKFSDTTPTTVLETANGFRVFDSVKVAQLFNEQFASVFTVDDGKRPEIIGVTPPPELMSDI